MYNGYINVLHNTYCHHGGIDVVSSIVGGTASNVEVVGAVCNRLYSKNKQSNNTYNYICCICMHALVKLLCICKMLDDCMHSRDSRESVIFLLWNNAGDTTYV